MVLNIILIFNSILTLMLYKNITESSDEYTRADLIGIGKRLLKLNLIYLLITIFLGFLPDIFSTVFETYLIFISGIYAVYLFDIEL